MNKFLFFLLGILVISSSKSFSETVTININANVIEQSCTISSNALNMIVDLQTADFRYSKVGVPFGGMPFSISLVDCPANISTALIKFSGESDSNMNSLLKNINESATAAQGITLGMYDVDNNNIDIQNNQERLNIDHSLTNQDFNFWVSYVKTNNVATAGKIISVVDFELSYD